MEDTIRQLVEQVQTLAESVRALSADRDALSMQLAQLQAAQASSSQTITELQARVLHPPRAVRTQSAVDVRVLGKPELFHGSRDAYVDWSLVFKAYMNAMDSTYKEIFDKAEASTETLYNAMLDAHLRPLSAQLYYVLILVCRGGALTKGNNAGESEGAEAWRTFAAEWDPKIRTRYVGSLMHILSHSFSGDISASIEEFERKVHAYEQQSIKTVGDDIKCGITNKGMEDDQIQKHLVKNSDRQDTWPKMRDEIRDMLRT